MSFVNDQLIEFFGSNEFDGKRKIVISSVGTSKRNNLVQYLGPNDILYAEVLPNPSLRQLVEFFRIVQPTEKDIIVGIGGGSVIDFSKLVALFWETPSNEVRSLIESARYHSIKRALKLVVIPTLFGSGAEQTPFAVCYINDNKYSVSNINILPQKTIYIPEINLTANKDIKAANIVDCTCQAVESLFAIGGNFKSKDYANQCLNLVLIHGIAYVRNSDINETVKISLASNYSGKAIAISKTTGPHALSYYLTKRLGISHGESLVVPFLYFLKIYQDNKNNDLHIKKVMLGLSVALDCDIEEVFESFVLFFGKIGIEISNLASLILQEIDINNWLVSVNQERLANNPRMALDRLNSVELIEFLNYLSYKSC